MILTDDLIPFLGFVGFGIACPWALWRIPGLRRVMPLAVLQIIAALLLGPTGLGHLSPLTFYELRASEGMNIVHELGWDAAVLFAMTTGLRVDLGDFKTSGRGFVALSLGNIILPLLIGIAAGWLLVDHPGMLGYRGTAPIFAISVGLVLAITALPVLAAILQEWNLSDTPLGRLALATAAVNDIAVWTLLATILALLQGRSGDAGILLLEGSGIIAGLAALRWLLAALNRRGDMVNVSAVIVIGAALGTALLTESMGLHAMIGAFAVGLVTPGRLTRDWLRPVETVILVLLLPCFFMASGMQTTIRLQSVEMPVLALLFTLLAGVAKAATVLVPGRTLGLVTGDRWRLAALLQCKGLMAVVVLSALWEAGAIGPAAYDSLLLMAVLSTALTAPMLALLERLSATA